MKLATPIRNMALAALALVAGGCFIAVGDVDDVVRSVTYPPDFRYLERSEIRGAMWELAVHARTLHEAVHRHDEGRRAAVSSALKGMEAAADRLPSDGRPTNHPLLNLHLPRLLDEVRAARRAVEAEPPSYLAAATVAGACLPCHTRTY